ncbi:MAG: hypothetical protein AAF196_06260 [Planctomycetota bacterium]
MTETKNPMDLSDIGPETEMAEVARRNPNLPVALMRYHIGGCTLCGYEPEDTVAKVAEDNGVPLEVLLEAVRR